MKELLDLRSVMDFCGMAVPLSVLMLENDEERKFAVSLYTEYKRFMFYIVKQKVDNLQDAEDIVGEAILRLISKTDALMSMNEAATRNYIASTVRNIAINYMRRNGKHDQNRSDWADESTGASGTDGPYEDLNDYLFNRFNVSELLAGFHRLTQEDRELLMLRHYDNLTIGDIAQLMNMSNKSVSSRLYKAKRRVTTEAESEKASRDAGRNETYGQ
jgi:RNA polymerase sigma-70 factor (ECF subfamily)